MLSFGTDGDALVIVVDRVRCGLVPAKHGAGLHCSGLGLGYAVDFVGGIHTCPYIRVLGVDAGGRVTLLALLNDDQLTAGFQEAETLLRQGLAQGDHLRAAVALPKLCKFADVEYIVKLVKELNKEA